MSYAHVTNSTINVEQAALPGAAQRLDTGQWISGFPNADVATQRACGWRVVIDTVAPTPTAGNTVDRTLALVGGEPTVVWVTRALTAAELTAQSDAANHSSILTNLAQDAVKAQTLIDTANATINANPATFLKDIARAQRRIIRVLTNQLDGTS